MELHDEYVFLMSEEKTEYSMILGEEDRGKKICCYVFEALPRAQYTPNLTKWEKKSTFLQLKSGHLIKKNMLHLAKNTLNVFKSPNFQSSFHLY